MDPCDNLQDILLNENDLDNIPDLISSLESQLSDINKNLENDEEYIKLKNSISKIESLIESGRDEICDAQEVQENCHDQYLECKNSVKGGPFLADFVYPQNPNSAHGFYRSGTPETDR